MELTKEGEVKEIYFKFILSKDELEALYIFLRGSSYQHLEPKFEKAKRILSDMQQLVSQEFRESDINASDNQEDWDPLHHD